MKAAPGSPAARALALVVGAQFLSSLADNALLIASIGMLTERAAPGWMTPALRFCFYVPYVLLAPLAGAWADRFAKGRVMLVTNLLKFAGCLLLAAGVAPLGAYALVGVGSAAYAPARYGILPELVPDAALVAANSWIEAATVLSIVGGVGLGAWLLANGHAAGSHLSAGRGAAAGLLIVYALATLCTAAIPARRPHRRVAAASGGRLAAFRHAALLLWRDPQAGVSLAVTTLFWAVAATLQFVVIAWGSQALGLPLERAALLQALVAGGIVVGAVAAARLVPTRRALAVLPFGMLLGGAILLMPVVRQLTLACVLLCVAGIAAGMFLVPMNALFQQRGATLMAPGMAVAVQNCSENLGSLLLLGIYGLLLFVRAPLNASLAGFGTVVTMLVALVYVQQRRRGALA